MPKIGDTLQLNCQLYDGATNKYVKAWLRDASGVALSPATATLAHVGEGLYSNDSVVMPTTQQVTAVIKVFDDAGFTTPSSLHSDVLDVFDLDTEISLPPDVTGFITSTNLTAKVLEC